MRIVSGMHLITSFVSRIACSEYPYHHPTGTWGGIIVDQQHEQDMEAASQSRPLSPSEKKEFDQEVSEWRQSLNRPKESIRNK